jgi:hypothetical protein
MAYIRDVLEKEFGTFTPDIRSIFEEQVRDFMIDIHGVLEAEIDTFMTDIRAILEEEIGESGSSFSDRLPGKRLDTNILYCKPEDN